MLAFNLLFQTIGNISETFKIDMLVEHNFALQSNEIEYNAA